MGKAKHLDLFMEEVRNITTQVVDATRILIMNQFIDTDPLGPCPKCKSPVYERAWFTDVRKVLSVTMNLRLVTFLYGRIIMDVTSTGVQLTFN